MAEESYKRERRQGIRKILSRRDTDGFVSSSLAILDTISVCRFLTAAAMMAEGLSPSTKAFNMRRARTASKKNSTQLFAHYRHTAYPLPPPKRGTNSCVTDPTLNPARNGAASMVRYSPPHRLPTCVVQHTIPIPVRIRRCKHESAMCSETELQR